MPWKVVQASDPWADHSADERHQGYWLAVLGSLVVFGPVTAVVVAPQPVGRLLTGCPSRASAVSSAAQRLGATHVTDLHYAAGNDRSSIARLDALIDGQVAHLRTISEYHHHWYGDSYSPAGTGVT